jgi:hypothetical protein
VVDLSAQLPNVPADSSHLVISLGGNDALFNIDLLALPVSSTAEALALFSERTGRFESEYRTAIDKVLQCGRPTTVCTIYNGNLSDSETARLAATVLKLFNDVILRVALENRLSVIDLRLICTEPEDYANEIEPSGQGGLKIALAIARSVGALDATTGFTSVVVC